MKQQIYYLKLWKKRLIFLGFLFMSSGLFAQTITSATIVTPICSGNNGVMQLTFASGTSFPFTLAMYGTDIPYQTVQITSSPQNVTIVPSTLIPISSGGYTVHFYDYTSQKYIGNFEASIHYDAGYKMVSPTCSSPATLTLSNLRNGASPYTVAIEDKNNNTLLSGSSPLSVAFGSVCPITNGIQYRITDANGCAFLTQDSGIHLTCNGLLIDLKSSPANCTDGKAHVVSVSGGTGSLSYLWNNGSTSDTIKNIRRGAYYVVVTDANNCSGIASTYIDQTTIIDVNTTSKSATCNFADGEANAFVSGGTAPYAYTWDNGGNTANNTSLTPGMHHVVVEDANLCLGDDYIYVGSTSPVMATYSTTPSSCTSATGTATLSISGGTTPYTIVWYGNSSTTTTASGLAVGMHSFTITDANGCRRDGTVEIPPVSAIYAKISGTDPVCPNNNGSASVMATSSAGGLSYLWNTGATTNSISSLAAGSYECTISDANGCSVKNYISLGALAPFNLRVATNDATCIYTADGSANAYINGGTGPFSYKWSDGSTSSSMTGKNHGRYSVSVTDANGCSDYQYATIGYDRAADNCYCRIEGRVYDDLDSNCSFGVNDEGLINAMIQISGRGSFMTRTNGYYSIPVPAGTYTVSQILDPKSRFSSCQSSSQTVTFSTTGSGCKQTVNFSNIVSTVHDVVIYPVQKNVPVPGNYYYHRLAIHNSGNKTEAGVDATLTDDQYMSLSSSWPSLSAVGNSYKPSSLMTINRQGLRYIDRKFYVPTATPMNTILEFRDSAAYRSPIVNYWIQNEETPWNNIVEYEDVVRSSYDPNIKSVFPKGKGPDGKIELEQKDFVYVVQFENNGTYYADKVVIIDTLDNDFDFNSFRTLDASHGVETQINSKGVVTFTFNNIHLDYTPKGVYKASAMGYVSYKIKAKNTVSIGTRLENFADIYFDYNAPVRTNTTVNTYDKESGIEQATAGNKAISVYPNPNTGELKIKLPEDLGAVRVEFMDIQGAVVMQINSYNSGDTIPTGSLNNGIYIVKVTGADGTASYVRIIKN